MAASTNTIKTRVQLKSDTEENWRKSVLTSDHSMGLKQSGNSFVPLLGELIVYIADDAHPFSRLKVGDGNTNVLALPFIDAGTINGDILPQSQVETYATRSLFPVIGTTNKLYIDLSTSSIYCYSDASGYTQLSNFNFTITTDTASQIVKWTEGKLSSYTSTGEILQIDTGILPNLDYFNLPVITNITRGGN